MEQIVKKFDEFIAAMRAAFADKSFTYTDRRKHIALLLFSRISSGCDTCQLLIQNGMISFFPVVLRSIHEASIDLINVTKDDNYPDIMLLSFAEQELKLLRHFETHKKYMTYFRDGSIPKQRLETAKGIVAKHKNIKNKTKLHSRFKSAGREIEYFSLYNDLCRSSHNNLDILVHVHSDNNGNDAIQHHTASIENTAKYIHSTTTIFAHSALVFCDFLSAKEINTSALMESAKSVLDLVEAASAPQPPTPSD